MGFLGLPFKHPQKAMIERQKGRLMVVVVVKCWWLDAE